MKNERYTPEGLPVLAQDTIDLFFRDNEQFDREGFESVLKNIERLTGHLSSTNPQVTKALDRFADEYCSDRFATYLAGVYVYELLKRQAEVNKLEEGK